MKERYRPYSNNGHLLSGKIFCAKCGATYKFKKYGDKHYWTCRTHDKKSELCENGRIAENNIYAAFIRLYNKLMYNYNGAILKKKTAKGKRWYNNKKG
ncbi:MAG: zinc ribbon domain-containing protein [Oscillospiraceae bacterium]|nr:zinc ribbon domain-containing protein [Ruminococcus sp.]